MSPAARPGSGNASPRTHRRVRPVGVPQYLTRIISSRLQWIDNDEEKEEIWNTAARRLSERSGRTGMGSMSRSFDIPGQCPTRDKVISITIHEPAMTEDNLGHKTWASSFVLAKKFREGNRSRLILQPLLGRSTAFPTRHDVPDILELGAGTGLVGLAAAAVFGCRVLLTDLSEIVENLQRNVVENERILDAGGGDAAVAVLDWRDPERIITVRHFRQTDGTDEDGQLARTSTDERRSLSVPIVVCADPIYSHEHPALLAKTIATHLRRDSTARAVVEMPIRPAYARERESFRQEMASVGLDCILEEHDTGFDDWDEEDDEPQGVDCWLSVWKWE